MPKNSNRQVKYNCLVEENKSLTEKNYEVNSYIERFKNLSNNRIMN